jgi:tetratricopeptide (TPR) repeat protein
MVRLFSGVAFSQQPNALESLLASAKQAQARSDFQAAAEFYRQALALHPEIPELGANLGLMYYQMGKDEQAAEAFRQALRLKPSLFVPNLFLGLDYVKLKRYNEAIPYLKRAVVSEPKDIQAHLGLGKAYAGKGNNRLAISAYRRAIQLDPRNAEVWYQLGVSYLEQIEADARILLVHHKESGYLQAIVADSFAEQHKYIQAAEAYKAALMLQSFPPGTHARYGFVLLNQRNLDGAEHEINSELRSNPGSLLAKLVLARLHIEQGETTKGAKEIQDAWKTDPLFVCTNAQLLNTRLADAKRIQVQKAFGDRQLYGDISEQLGALLRGSAETEESSDSPQRSITCARQTSPSDKGFSFNAAEYYAQGRYTQCSNSLAPRVHFLKSKDLELLAICSYSIANYKAAANAAQMLMARSGKELQGLYWETKSTQKLASEVLARASQLDSTSPKLHLLLGDVYRQRLSLLDAEREYRKALSLRPEDVGARFGLALTLLGNSDVDAAFRVAQSVAQEQPDDPELNALMGEILCARRDFSVAEPYLRKGLNAKPELVAHVHALLGKVYAETNRTQQAIAELMLGLVDDKDGSLHYQIGRLYLKVGDHDLAKQAFEVSDQMRREGLIRAAIAMKQGEDYSDSQ